MTAENGGVTLAPGRARLARLARDAAKLAWRAHAPLLLIHIALAVAAGVLPVITAWLTKLVFDGLSGPSAQGTSALVGPGVGLALAGVAVITLPRLANYVGSRFNRAVAIRVKEHLYESVERLPGLAPFEQPTFHNQLSLAASSGAVAPTQVVSGGLTLGQAVVTLAGFVATLVVIAPWMLIVVLLAALPGLRAETILARRRAKVMQEIVRAGRREAFYAQLLASPSAAMEVRLFGLGALFRRRMQSELRNADAHHERMDRAALAGHLPLAVLSAVVAGGGLLWAIASAHAGRLGVGDIAVFLAAVSGIQSGLASAFGSIGVTHEGLLLFGNLHAIASADPGLTATGTRAVRPLRSGIEFRDVWFRYADDQPWVLRGVSATLTTGTTSALVGLNGAGKSTMVKLLCRLYDPVRGTIYWDGVDLRELDLAELRSRIGVVFQNFMAYELTAAENIAVGDVSAWGDRSAVVAAAAAAGCEPIINALPNGYDTLLTRVYSPEDGDDHSTGVVLSGGQWQRVALARAFMRRDRDLLILDEPSAGLDAEAEYAVHQRLRQLRHGKTSLLISHRLSTVRDADIILVLNDGQITERGTHDELMSIEDGVYRRLFTIQAEGYGAEAVPVRAAP